jgi:hypothetical protein
MAKTSKKEVIDFDPNLVLCGRTVDYKVRLIFADRHYRKEMVVEVGGNVRGFDVIESAINQAYAELPYDEKYGEIKEIYFEDKTSTLCVADDHEQEEDFLKELLISAEIIGIQPRSR